MVDLVRFEDLLRNRKRRSSPTFFTKVELNSLLSLYSQRVASGEWRDYAIDHRVGTAYFSVFRHSYERPLYVFYKRTLGSRGKEFGLLSGREQLATATSLLELFALVERKRMLRVVS